MLENRYPERSLGLDFGNSQWGEVIADAMEEAGDCQRLSL
jgi:hypothetical protein